MMPTLMGADASPVVRTRISAHIARFGDRALMATRDARFAHHRRANARVTPRRRPWVGDLRWIAGYGAGMGL